MVWVFIGYTSQTSLNWIDCNLNLDRYISDILHPIFLPCVRGLPNTIFQENARPHDACHFLTFLDAQDIRLLLWQEWSPVLSTTENIWSKVAQRLTRHPFPVWLPEHTEQILVNKVNSCSLWSHRQCYGQWKDELWDKFEATWYELSIFVIKARFDSLSNRVWAVLSVRGGSWLY